MMLACRTTGTWIPFAPCVSTLGGVRIPPIGPEVWSAPLDVRSELAEVADPKSYLPDRELPRIRHCRMKPCFPRVRPPFALGRAPTRSKSAQRSPDVIPIQKI